MNIKKRIFDMLKKCSLFIELLILIFILSCSIMNSENKLQQLGENYIYMMMLIDSYYNEMAHYPLPIWIFDDPYYFDIFIHKKEGWDKKLISRWDKVRPEIKKRIIAGEVENTDNLNIGPIIWIINGKGKDKRYSPFWGDIQYDFSCNIKRWDIPIEKLQDPFSNEKKSIRYSLHHPTCIMCFISNGPDMDEDINEKDIFGYDLYKDYTAPDINLIYDPTNGVKSSGDIFFTTYNSGENFKYEDILSHTPAFKSVKLKQY
jgi:hypothetical protein